MPTEGEYSVLVGTRNLNAGLQARVVEKTLAFTGASGLGAVGTADLFTVTGTVIVSIVAVCTEDLVGGSATIEVGTAGIAGHTADIIAQTTATDIINLEIWHDNSPDSDIEGTGILLNKIINQADIKATIGAQPITDGTIKFILTYTPISDGATVVAA